MDDPLNNFLQAENMLFNNDNNDIPNELNTLFNENNIEPFAIFGFNNNNNNLLNDNMEGPTGYTLHIHPQEPIVNEHEFQNRERRRERGRGESNVEGHTKYAFDNMVRKTKSMIIKLLLNFINKKIFVIYDGKIGHGDNIKKLFLMNQAQVSNANINFNRAFLERTLGEIFSADLSKRISNYKKNHNKTLIEELINEKDKEKKEYFNCLFNLTFSDCLKYFRSSNNVNNPKYIYIEGLTKFCDLENDSNFKQQNEREFIEYFKNFINNYENNLSYRRARLNNNIENQ